MGPHWLPTELSQINDADHLSWNFHYLIFLEPNIVAEGTVSSYRFSVIESSAEIVSNF